MKETLNEQIRNKLSPIKNLIELVETFVLNDCKEGHNKDFDYKKFLAIEECKDSIDEILRLTKKL